MSTQKRSDKLTLFNICSSIKVPVDRFFKLNEVKYRAEHFFGYYCELYTSYLTVFVTNSSLRFIIFKKAAKKNHSHVNCTGVRNFSDHDIAVKHLCVLMECKPEDVEVKLNNLSGSVDSILHHLSRSNLKCVNLIKFAEVLDRSKSEIFTWRFNPETYSSIVFTYKERETCLLYNSGKLTVTGSKNIECMKEAANWMARMIMCVLMQRQ